jgi:hypothetical protein
LLAVAEAVAAAVVVVVVVDTGLQPAAKIAVAEQVQKPR